MMRSLLAASLLLATSTMSVAAGPVDAGGYEVTETVTEELRYDTPAGFTVEATDDLRTYSFVSACDTSQFGCIQFDVRDDYRMYEVEIVDDLGETVLGTSLTEGLPDVCGATEGLVELYEGVDEVAFFVTAGTCEDGTASLPSSGIVRITFYASNDAWA